MVSGGITSTPVFRGDNWAGERASMSRSAENDKEATGRGVEEDNVFAAVVAAFKTLQGDMTRHLIDHALTEAKNNCSKYKSEK